MSALPEQETDWGYAPPSRKPHSLLTAEEEVVLCRQAQGGCRQSRDQMVEANLRLVTSIAGRFHGRSTTFDDLVQEGVVGLILAIDRFDTSRGTRFSTFATHWIRQGIGRALEKSDRIIRIPSHAHVVERHARKAEERLHAATGRAPRDEEIILEAEMSPSIARTYYRLVEDSLSIDGMQGTDDGEVVDFICDDQQEGPEEAAVREDWEARVRRFMERLSDRERLVIEARFGFHGFPQALRQIGKALGGMSHETARLTEVTALKKLRRMMHEEGFDFEP